MFEIFGNLFARTENSKLGEAIQQGAFLVDVRMPYEFEADKVKGSVNIPLNRLQGELEKFKDKKSIVVFCRSGNRSGQAKAILEQNGFRNVINGGTSQNLHAYVNQEK
ncbi:rhodanese-like domain-containing protein [Negadavirga shengliensis]|uniref:Rhodanese-like domain-containing protein n=1 Tax=Negadavirga shengliensis TaxID=1389218 RepID=A0ABV9T4X4_9BACT